MPVVVNNVTMTSIPVNGVAMTSVLVNGVEVFANAKLASAAMTVRFRNLDSGAWRDAYTVASPFIGAVSRYINSDYVDIDQGQYVEITVPPGTYILYESTLRENVPSMTGGFVENSAVLKTFTANTTLTLGSYYRGEAVFAIVAVSGVHSVGTPVGKAVIMAIQDGIPSVDLTMAANQRYILLVKESGSYKQYGDHSVTINNVKYEKTGSTNLSLWPLGNYSGVVMNSSATYNYIVTCYGGGNGGDTTNRVVLMLVAIPVG